ncbi:MAG: DUF1232 domain-containing protein [Bacteroidia bacterium]|nr:DUF1232 domain-containing protein [Bacteroidia bacterium]
MSSSSENKKPRGFDGAKRKAESFAGDKGKTKKLIREAIDKAKKNKGSLGKVWVELQALIRLLKAWLIGKYKTPWKTIVFSSAALIYFVNPLDLLPDFIPVLGFLDDASVIAFVISSVRTDIKDFLNWEKKEEGIVDVEIIEETDIKIDKTS